MKRLLVATDLSARSDRALDRAVDLARRHRARLTVLHVVDEDPPCTAREAVVAAAEAEIASALASRGRRADDDVAIRVVAGNDYREILDVAEAEASDLIVLGRHRDEACHTAIGATTMSGVIRMGERPVLVVTRRTEGAYRKVMIGVDFSPFSRRAVRAALALAPGAEVHLVHAFDVPFEAFLPGRAARREVEEEHDRALSRLIEEEIGVLAGGPGIERVLRQGDVRGVLRHEAERLGADLLVIGTHGRTGLAHAILGSVAQDLLDRPPCDVLAVKSTAGRPRG